MDQVSHAAHAPPCRPARLLSAPWVIPVSRPPIREGALAVDAVGTVIAVGSRADLLRDLSAHPPLPETRGQGALVPGLVNAHTHLELSWLAGAVPGGDGVIAWTRRLAARLAAPRIPTDAKPAARDADDATTAAFAAAAVARDLGTAALGDVGNGTAGWRAMAHAGLGGLFFHELVGSRERRTGDALADAATERAAIPEAARPGTIAAVPAPHAPYSVGPALLRRIFAAAAAAGLPTSIHLAEDADELALLERGGGGWPDVLRAMGVDPAERTPHLGPCAYLDGLGAFAPFAPPPLLVHMVHASADDRARARAAGATVVLCPRSNLYIGGRLPDVRALCDEGVALALGTDSLASTPDLSLWSEMATLARALPEQPPRRWLEAATVGGARALGLDATLGQLEVGRQPGILDVLLAPGETDPERALVADPAPTLRWLALAFGAPLAPAPARPAATSSPVPRRSPAA